MTTLAIYGFIAIAICFAIVVAPIAIKRAFSNKALPQGGWVDRTLEGIGLGALASAAVAIPGVWIFSNYDPAYFQFFYSPWVEGLFGALLVIWILGRSLGWRRFLKFLPYAILGIIAVCLIVAHPLLGAVWCFVIGAGWFARKYLPEPCQRTEQSSSRANRWSPSREAQESAL
jgi:hypothetical protein